MLIVEDLLLLLTDDDTGKHLVGDPALDLGLAGACVIELAARHQVDLAGEDERVKRGRLIVRDPTPTGDHVLDTALQRLGENEGRKPANVLKSISKELRGELLERLSSAGIVRQEQGRVLGIFPVKRWPVVDSRHENQVRTLLSAALVQGTTPDDRTRALIALLSALDVAHRVVDGSQYGVNGRTIKKRAKVIREADWAAGAVSSAIQAVQAAVSAAVMASVIASTTAASGGS